MPRALTEYNFRKGQTFHLNLNAGSAVPLKAELKKLEKTKFCKMYRMPKILLNDEFRKTGNFPYKCLF
jgi:hypothetical protein